MNMVSFEMLFMVEFTICLNPKRCKSDYSDATHLRKKWLGHLALGWPTGIRCRQWESKTRATTLSCPKQDRYAG